MKVEFRENFLKDLSRIKNTKLFAKVRQAVENVEESANPREIRNFKKLKGSQFYYRIRIGQYRVGLKLDDDTIIFIRFLSRKEIYRFFP